MANNEFNDQRAEQIALSSGDNKVAKLSFREVMEGHKDPLMEAFEKNQADILKATARIADIHQRAAQAHPGGLDGFLKDHAAA